MDIRGKKGFRFISDPGLKQAPMDSTNQRVPGPLSIAPWPALPRPSRAMRAIGRRYLRGGTTITSSNAYSC